MEEIQLVNILSDPDGNPINTRGKILGNVVLRDGTPDPLFISEELLVNNGLHSSLIVEKITLEDNANGLTESQEPTDEIVFLEEESLLSTSFEESCNWDSQQTKFLLDKYNEYLPHIWPMNKLQTKRKMWEKISDDLTAKFKIKKTALQVENRFNTILKRKKKATKNNNTSGEVRMEVEDEEEISKIAAQDDSITPEVLKDQCKTITNKEVLKEIAADKQKQWEEYFRQKELEKERRHKEKLDLLRDIFVSAKK